MTAGATVQADEDAEGVNLTLVFPVSEGHIHDNWHVTGLEGSGSNDISATELFVPEAFQLGPRGVGVQVAAGPSIAWAGRDS